MSSPDPRTSPIRVLVIEDERKLGGLIQNAILTAGHAIEVAQDGETGLSKALTAAFDVIILDLMLPKRDGLSVLREMRTRGMSTPVLVLSARSEVGERVEGLDAGADDYLPKPFVIAELLARVRALGRRRQEQRTGPLQIADLTLDPLKRTVRRGSKSILLAAREYKLLEFFMRSQGQICSRSEIIKKVWEYSFDPGTNLVDVYIMRVREKIDDDFQRKLLHTIRGIGYVLKEAE